MENQIPDKQNINPQGTSSNLNQVQTPSPKKKSKEVYLFFTLLVLLVLTVSTTSAVYIFKSMKPKPTPTPQLVKTPTPTIIQNNNTSDWKTYNNTKVGFQIKYPPAYDKPQITLVESRDATAEEDNTVIGFPLREGKVVVEKNLGFFTYPNSGPLTGIYNMTPFAKEDPVTNLGKGPLVDGSESLLYEIKDTQLNKPIVYHRIVFIGKEHAFIFDYDKSSEPEALQILSTFKFTSPNQSVDTSTWKSYTNPIYGLNIQYPGGFTPEEKTFNSTFTVLFSDKSQTVPGEGGTSQNPYFVMEVIPYNATIESYVNDTNNNITLLGKKTFGANEFVNAKETMGIASALPFYLIKHGNYIIKLSDTITLNNPTQFANVLGSLTFKN